MVKVLVPLAQGCEELEAVTIINLLRRADIEVISAGLEESLTPITASRGVVLLPDKTLDEVLAEHFDMIVLPGGLPGADHLNADQRIQDLLQRMAQQGQYIAAICAAPKILAHAGLLAGRKATSYPGVLDKMVLPATQVLLQQSVVDDKKVITSRGPGTAMDFALHLIEQLVGKNIRDQVEEGLVKSF